MIRINLLPVKRKKKTQPLPPFIIQGIIVLIVTIAVLAFFGFHIKGKVASKQSQKAQKEKKLAELNEQLKEVANFEKDNALFERQNKVIEQLKSRQKAPLVLLDEVSARLPEGVWLVELKEQAGGGSVNLMGYAFSNSELVSYVQRLKGSRYLTNVALVESRQSKIGQFSVYKFKIQLKVKV
jgi:type IV pilus assembly protein PilN